MACSIFSLKYAQTFLNTVMSPIFGSLVLWGLVFSLPLKLVLIILFVGMMWHNFVGRLTAFETCTELPIMLCYCIDFDINCGIYWCICKSKYNGWIEWLYCRQNQFCTLKVLVCVMLIIRFTLIRSLMCTHTLWRIVNSLSR